MSAHKSPLRDRLLSNSPDPIKSSIMRDSGMGWISPTSNPGSTSSGSSGSITSPLRISKRDSPRILSQPQVARRSSSSYKHVRNNNLVSKSPFKSQIPTPLSTPSRHIPISFPSPRRVSGEKRPRPSSIHEQAENENDRPFAFKRERRQSKGFQGLIQKEPVTKSPFRQRTPSAEEASPLPPPPPLAHLIPRNPNPPLPSESLSASLAPAPMPISSNGVSPARSSLVSRRMHGPRLSSGGGGRRERRKTVTFDERCDVVEFDREEETDEETFGSAEEDDYGMEDDQPEEDPFFGGNRSSAGEPVHGRAEDTSYESIQLSDISGDDGSLLLGMALDPDASISGLVDEIFSSSSAATIGVNSSPTPNVDQMANTATATSTPPRHNDSTDLPVDLETDDGVPFGRSHHAARFLQHQRQLSQSPQQPPPHFSPHRQQHPSSGQHVPEGYAFNLPTHASPHGPPATPPRRSMAPSPAATHHLRTIIENVDAHSTVTTPPPPSSHHSTPPPDISGSHLAPPPLGRSTHLERVRQAREDECDDVLMLPGTPSPVKSARKPMARDDFSGEGLIPRFGIDIGTADISASSHGGEDDPFALSSETDRNVSSIVNEEPPTSESLLDPANLSIGGSEVGLNRLDNDGDDAMKGIEDTSLLEDDDRHELFARGGFRGQQTELQHQASEDEESTEELPAPPTRALSPDVHSPSPNFHASSSRESLSDEGSGKRLRISKDDMRRRLLDRRSSLSPPHINSKYEKDQAAEGETMLSKDEDRKGGDSVSVLTMATDISAEMAVIGHAEKTTLSGMREAKEIGLLEVKGGGERLQFDFGSKFGMGGLDFGNAGYDARRSSMDSMGVMIEAGAGKEETGSIQSGGSIKMGDVDVDMDMRSALDRLMDDVGGTRANDSMATDEGDSYDDPRQSPPASIGPSGARLMERVATDSALLHNNGFVSRNASMASATSVPPPVPPKDNIRSREQLIIEKRREARRMEEEDEDYYPPAKVGGRGRGQELLGVGRPSRRRSMSTGDADTLGGGSKKRGDDLLDIPVGEHEAQDEHFGDSIEKELQKLGETPTKYKTKYHVRERQGTIYASSSDPDIISHMAGPGDVNAGKAWRAVRRPSDMNEYSKQIKEYRAQEKPGKAYGKVFVKVLGVKGIHVPLPQQPTALTCTLNNGIHFVSTPECQLGRDFRIEQEFELIEHSKLEFTLTLKIRRDPHIIAQFKAVAPPPPAPAPAPPPVVQTSSKGGMRSFFSSSPKKSAKEKPQVQPPAPQPQTQQRLTENLARYLKPDGTLARAFISFKDIASRCDTKLFETSYPLIGQRVELGNKFSTLQVGEIVLQMFRLPPLPGISPEQLPQSLEECHRGLRHINWHKVTYFEGTLTQSGGDCSTWRRRQLRIIGSNLVAFNDVTKKATATIDLKKAIAVEDDQEGRRNALSSASGTTARSSRHDEYEGLYGVERSFRLVFPQEQEISFFADTDEEKARWLDVLRALVGHIPPHPLWAELLWQRQDEVVKGAQQPMLSPSASRPPAQPSPVLGGVQQPLLSPSASRPPAQSSPSWLVARSQPR